MSYKSDSDFEEQPDDLDIQSIEPVEEVELEENIHEDPKNSHQHALEVRRAIEDHLDRSRLQKEFDYLYNDDFEEDEEAGG